MVNKFRIPNGRKCCNNVSYCDCSKLTMVRIPQLMVIYTYICIRYTENDRGERVHCISKPNLVSFNREGNIAVILSGFKT